MPADTSFVDRRLLPNIMLIALSLTSMIALVLSAHPR
jgi:hypothetical protein